MLDTPNKWDPQTWTKALLTDVPQEIRNKIYEECCADGFMLHCNTMRYKDHGRCLYFPNLNDVDKTQYDRVHGNVMVDREPRRESTLSKLLRTCRVVNQEVSQLYLSLLSRRPELLQPASCVNSAIWWAYNDLRLVDPNLKEDRIPKFVPRTVRGERLSGIPEWRIEFIATFLTELIRARGVYELKSAVISQRVHLYDFTGRCYRPGRLRGFDYVEGPNQILVVDVAYFPKEGQCIGMADLVKCIVAIEVVLQVLEARGVGHHMGAGTRGICQVYNRPGVRAGESLAVFEAEGWQIVGWRDLGLEGFRS